MAAVSGEFVDKHWSLPGLQINPLEQEKRL